MRQMANGTDRIKGATIRDVARVAEVSIGTVSRYLNGYELRERNRLSIETAIAELGFKENIIAKGLKSNRTMTVGVVIDNLTDIFMTSVVTSVEQWLERMGYSTILCDYQGDNTKLDRKLQFLKDRHVDGLILFPYGKRHAVLNDYLKDRIPVVLINDDLEDFSTDTIQVDNRRASRLATSHLLDLGHDSIAFIRGRKGAFTADERYYGFIEAYEKKIGVNPDYLVFEGYFEPKGGYEAMRAILASELPVTGVFSSSYAMTMGALFALNEAGRSFPADYSFISFDDFEMFDMVRPRLSVIKQPMWKMGEHAASQLYRRIQGDYDGFPEKIVLSTEYIERDSVESLRRKIKEKV